MSGGCCWEMSFKSALLPWYAADALTCWSWLAWSLVFSKFVNSISVKASLILTTSSNTATLVFTSAISLLACFPVQIVHCVHYLCLSQPLFRWEFYVWISDPTCFLARQARYPGSMPNVNMGDIIWSFQRDLRLIVNRFEPPSALYSNRFIEVLDRLVYCQ